MKRAWSVKDVINKKHETIELEDEWYDAFGCPELKGVWFIWGNSGNGKSSFTMQLCKELTKHGRVIYNSLEEGIDMTMSNTLERYRMDQVGSKFQIVKESIEELEERMSRRKSPKIYVIDSLQYTQLRYKQYLQIKERHKNKLIIFISHAKGVNPSTDAAVSIMFDASLKIWVEGYKAFSKGRFIGPTGEFTIWKQGADRYWLDKLKE